MYVLYSYRQASAHTPYVLQLQQLALRRTRCIDMSLDCQYLCFAHDFTSIALVFSLDLYCTLVISEGPGLGAQNQAMVVTETSSTRGGANLGGRRFCLRFGEVMTC